MTLATFNVWHGLAGRGLFKFREFESEERRARRWARALRELAMIDPDVLFLQELNPVARKFKDVQHALGGVGWSRVDQGGIRAFSTGLPLNLTTGLGLLARGCVEPAAMRQDGIEIPESVQLSGGPFVSGEAFSLQIHEIRCAQIHSLNTKDFGRLLVVNTHLHHGFERFARLLELLKQYQNEKRIEEATAEKLLAKFDQARNRRMSEVDRILEIVENASPVHDGCVIAGDLNSTPEGQAVRMIRLAGFHDVASTWGKSEPTWDPETNSENHRLQETFHFPLPTFGNPELHRLYRDFDALARRIDFIFVRGSLAARAPSKVGVFGQPDESGLAPSDHYGVFAKWT